LDQVNTSTLDIPLPDLIQTIRTAIYPKLAPIANSWMKVLNIERQYPDRFDDLQKLCHDHNQIYISPYSKIRQGRT
jgi:hypothetical protein